MLRLFATKSRIYVIITFIIVFAMAGCGGGGGGGESSSGGGSGSGGGGGVGASLMSATLSWSPISTNSDGSPLDDLAGFKVYYGTSSGNYTDSVDVPDVSATSVVISGLPANVTYYFVVVAYDTSGNESPYSNEGVKTP